jgi:hypothetical protein
VSNHLRHPRVAQAARQSIGHAQPLLDLAKQQQPAVGGQAPAVETRVHRLAGNR